MYFIYVNNIQVVRFYLMMKKLLYLILFVLFFSCHEEQTIPVVIDVFLHVKDDHTSPLYVTIENNTRSASNYLWSFNNGEPATSISKDPGTIVFTTPGEHTITLEAWNDGDSAKESYTVWVDSAATASFAVYSEINNYAPAVFNINNVSVGGSSYLWTFEGGVPSQFEGQYPPAVTYTVPGKYIISLVVNNGSATFTMEQEIEVRETLDASFSIVPSFEDEDDMEAPVRAVFDTMLQGVETVCWECDGAIISNPESAEASILFPKEGLYTVWLTASNGKEEIKTARDIMVKANTNLRTHRDIKLGISTAQDQIGTFYSTKLRSKILNSELTPENDSEIDIAFYGMNRQFIYNQFISPDSTQYTSLKAIPSGRETKFINKQEMGNLFLSVEQFSNMTTDLYLQPLQIKDMNYGWEHFNKDVLPRVVLFETWDSRKGAILVKEMVDKGINESYIVVDIKIQKND